MNKQTQMFLMIGLGGVVAWLGYRYYQEKKAKETSEETLANEHLDDLSKGKNSTVATDLSLTPGALRGSTYTGMTQGRVAQLYRQGETGYGPTLNSPYAGPAPEWLKELRGPTPVTGWPTPIRIGGK